MAPTPIVISVKNLVKTYVVGEIEVKALRGVNLDVQQGEFLAVEPPAFVVSEAALKNSQSTATRPPPMFDAASAAS